MRRTKVNSPEQKIYIYSAYDPTKKIGAGDSGDVFDVKFELKHSSSGYMTPHQSKKSKVIKVQGIASSYPDAIEEHMKENLISRQALDKAVKKLTFQKRKVAEIPTPNYQRDKIKSYMVMEKLGDTNIQDIVKTELTIEQRWKLSCNLIQLLEFLHNRGVIHKDLHQENIRVNSETMELYPIDFGHSALIDIKEKNFPQRLKKLGKAVNSNNVKEDLSHAYRILIEMPINSIWRRASLEFQPLKEIIIDCITGLKKQEISFSQARAMLTEEYTNFCNLLAAQKQQKLVEPSKAQQKSTEFEPQQKIPEQRSSHSYTGTFFEILPTDNFADHIAKGEGTKAKALLDTMQQNNQQTLLRTPCTFTDYSGRTFKCPAPLYAYWAKDARMWRMLMEHMDDETKAVISEHIEEMESMDPLTNKAKGLAYQLNGTTHHSVHFDLTALKTKLENYTGHYDEWKEKKYNAIIKAWKEVGQAQRDVPAHIAVEYCTSTRSFASIPQFNESSLPLTLTYSYLGNVEPSNLWFPLSNKLGTEFAFFRGSGQTCRASDGPPSIPVTKDLAAITHLDEVRTAEFVKFREDLKPQKDIQSEFNIKNM